MVWVFPGKGRSLNGLGDISRPPIKNPTVANPYQRKRVGIDICVVPKSTIAPPTQATRPRKAGIPSQVKEGRVGTLQPTVRTERAPRRAANARNGCGRSAQKNDHITRKKAGKAYNPALEADPGPPLVTTEEGADLQGHTLTVCSRKLRLVSKDHVHCNNGTHLTGGIANDALWQTRWSRISNLTLRFYDALKGKAGRRFVTLLTKKLRAARERFWNSKILIAFIGTVLSKIPWVKKSKYIQARLLRRMDHWTDVLVGALVEYTCGTGNARGGRAGAISE